MARGPTELAKLSVKDFYRVVAGNPVLWDQLRTESKQRDELLAAVEITDTGTVWAAGHDAALLSSDNRGASWTLRHHAPEEEGLAEGVEAAFPHHKERAVELDLPGGHEGGEGGRGGPEPGHAGEEQGQAPARAPPLTSTRRSHA